jgi:hypothetical protein
MNTYEVRQYFVVTLLVTAEDSSEAIAEANDIDYTVTTQFKNFAGGPEICRPEMDDEVIFIKGENDEM